MPTPTERLDAIEAHIDRVDDLLERLVTQNQKIGEVVEMLGRYVDTTVDYVQQHEADPDAHEGGE